MDATLTTPDLVPAPPPPPPAPFVPVTEGQRIVALDVVRGFALLGIFLMNIEWFNRPFAAFSEGIPRDAALADWWAAWFVNYFVAGKFWTIFSLLFGMGFAVMLVRAERAGRPFVQIYLRRILALAVFGAVHFIFLWEGDILFSYAVGALALLIVLYGRARLIVLGVIVFIGLGMLPDADAFFAIAGGLATIGLLALYLRGTRRLRPRGAAVPVFSAIVMLAGAALTVAALVFWFVPNLPTDPRLPLSVMGPMLFITGWLSWKYVEPADKRSLRVAVAIYIFFGVLQTAMSTVQHFMPDPLLDLPPVAGTTANTTATAAGVAPAGTSKVAAAVQAGRLSAAATKPAAVVAASQAASSAKAASKPPKTPAEKRAERDKRLREQAERKVDEIKVFSTGTYLQAVDWRARKFLEKAAGDAGFSVALVGMFLLGMWFVRSGVMDNTTQHLPLFRKMALWGLPVGLGLSLLTCLIAVSHSPGARYDGWGIARGLVTLSGLPACLGYVGLVVVALHSNTVFSHVRALAPLGRMALTNYLMQSTICMLYFYGFGLAHWGMPRSQQVLFVVVVYALQVAFSTWWLARFRYGPMEWLWRGFTYRQVPPLRLAAQPMATPPQVAS